MDNMEEEKIESLHQCQPLPHLIDILRDDFNEMPVTEREKLVFQIIEDVQNSNFNNDVKYEDIMNVSNSKKSSSITPPNLQSLQQ